LVQVFCLVKEELAILDDDDADSVQRLKVLKCVLAAMQCYTEVLKEKKMKASQTPLLSFFEKRKALKHLNLTPLPEASLKPNAFS
jgi:hypothetical protein